MIYITRALCPRNSFLMFYNADSKPIVDYGTLSNGSANRTELVGIDMSQGRALRAFLQSER